MFPKIWIMAETIEKLDRIRAYLHQDPMIKFAYLFGSHARGDVGLLSDVDIAVFLDGRLNFFRYRLGLMDNLARILGDETFDLVSLNDAPLILCYEIVKEGKLLKEDKPSRVDFETRVLNRYLDTAYLRKIQQAYLKEHFSRECDLGE